MRTPPPTPGQSSVLDALTTSATCTDGPTSRSARRSRISSRTDWSLPKFRFATCRHSPFASGFARSQSGMKSQIGVVPRSRRRVHRRLNRVVVTLRVVPVRLDVPADVRFDRGLAGAEQIPRDPEARIEILPARHAVDTGEVAGGNERSRVELLLGNEPVEVVEAQTEIQRDVFQSSTDPARRGRDSLSTAPGAVPASRTASASSARHSEEPVIHRQRRHFVRHPCRKDPTGGRASPFRC